ncbi:MAG: GxxExxY protein [Planctomycetaceae bacterium]
MNENEAAGVIVDAAIHVHRALGPGLLESVYERILEHELKKRGLTVQRQVPVSVVYDGLVFDDGFRVDLIVNSLVIVELKSIEALAPVHGKQLLTYLKLTSKKLGLLMNFGEVLLKNGIHRVVNGLDE